MPEIPEDIKELAIEKGNNPELGIVFEQTSKLNIILDMSKFDLFQLCQFRYYIRYVLERAPQKRATALDKGGLLHEGFDVYYSLLKEGAHFNDRIHAALQAVKTISCNPELCQLEQEDIDDVIRTLPENLDYWRHEDEFFNIHFVEQAFARVIYEDDYVRIILSGKIDLLVDIPRSSRSSGYSFIPIDHKSSSRSSETYRLSNQFMCYADAVGSNYLIVNKVGFQTSLKPIEKFIRVPLSYDAEILQEWKDNIKTILLEDYLNCLSSNTWKQNFTSCNKFNRLCEYYEVCDTSGKEAKLWKLNTEFGTASPWDVTRNLTFNKGLDK